MEKRPSVHRLRTLVENVALALVYVATARLSQEMAIDPGNICPVWIPSGIMFAAVLLTGNRLLPAVFFGALTGNLHAYLDWETFENLPTALSAAVLNGLGDSLGVGLGAHLLRKTTGTAFPFSAPGQVARFVLYGAVLASAVSMALGVGGLMLTGMVSIPSAPEAALTWFVGDTMGVMVLSPFLLSLVPGHGSVLGQGRLPELCLYLIVGMVVSFFSLGLWHFPWLDLPLVVLFPLLGWALFRFHPKFVFLSLVLLSTTAVIATATGVGPFYKGAQNIRLMELQLFLMVMCSTIYVLLSLLIERKNSAEKLLKTAISLQEAQLSLVDAERMQTVGRLAAGVAHEVKNPLAVIRLSIDYLKTKLDQDDAVITQVENRLYEAVERANGIVMGMLDFGAPKPLSQKDLRIHHLVEEAVKMTEHAMIQHKVDVRKDFPEELPVVKADAEKCIQVLVNLFLNACHAIGEHGTIELRMRNRRMQNRQDEHSDQLIDALELTVEDSGPGIPEEVLPKLFEPFFTTKEGEGTGLGLCVSRMIMHLHGGDLIAENREGGGARFTVIWPLASEVQPRLPAQNIVG